MQEDVNLIRRPLVLHGKKAVFGYDAEEYERL
jgi:arsenate reductase-like glutaredoxin family protein